MSLRRATGRVVFAPKTLRLSPPLLLLPPYILPRVGVRYVQPLPLTVRAVGPQLQLIRHRPNLHNVRHAKPTGAYPGDGNGCAKTFYRQAYLLWLERKYLVQSRVSTQSISTVPGIYVGPTWLLSSSTPFKANGRKLSYARTSSVFILLCPVDNSAATAASSHLSVGLEHDLVYHQPAAAVRAHVHRVLG